MALSGLATLPQRPWRPAARIDGRTARTPCPSCSGTWCGSAATAWPCARSTSASGAPSPGASTASGRARVGPRAGRARAPAAATSSRSWPTTARSGSTPTWARMSVGGVTNGIYTDRLGHAGRVHRQRQRHALPLRRERGAARQDPRGARALPASSSRSSSSTWRACTTSSDAQVHAVRRSCSRSGARYDREHPGAVRPAGRDRPARGPGHAGLHLRHHRPAQGRDAVATATSCSSSSNADAFIPLARGRPAARPSCRSATSPSAPSPSSSRCAPAPSSTSPRASRRCPRTSARWRPPLFFAVPRIWEKLLLRHRPPHDGGDLARPPRLPAGRSASGCAWPSAGSRAAGRRWPCGLAYRRRRLPRARQHQARDRLHRARGAATGAAPIAPDLIKLVPALGVDMREVYGQTENCGLATAHAARPHQARHRRRRRGPTPRCAISPEGEILLKGPHVFMGYYNQPEKTAETLVRRLAAHRRRRASSTPRASSRSPTA